MPSTYDIRPLDEARYRDFLTIMADAYPGIGLSTPEDIDKRLERMKRRMQDTSISMWGAFESQTLVGVQLFFDLTLNLHGRKVLCGGLGSVAVHLMHKKRHVGRDLVHFYLQHYDQSQSPILALWPFRHQFYRDMGFGFGTRIHRYEIKPEWLPKGNKGHVRFLTASDTPALVGCLNRLADRHNGMTVESEHHWSYMFEFDQRSRYVGFEQNGQLEGVMVYGYKPRGADNFIDNDIDVRLLCYETPEALAELLGFLHSQLDQINRVFISTDDEDFHLLLTDIWNREYRLIAPVFHESSSVGHGVMYRILGVRRAFEAVSDHNFGGSGLTIKITVRDTFSPQHDGAVTVAFREGRAMVCDQPPDVEIALDIAEFSSLFMGATTFRTLHSYGLATISDPSYLEAVDRTFACLERPICHADF